MLLILRERLLNKLNQRKEELTISLLKGSPEDFAAYRYLTGRIRGVEDSLELIRAVFKGEDDEIN
jgi:hypothetical protein